MLQIRGSFSGSMKSSSDSLTRRNKKLQWGIKGCVTLGIHLLLHLHQAPYIKSHRCPLSIIQMWFAAKSVLTSGWGRCGQEALFLSSAGQRRSSLACGPDRLPVFRTSRPYQEDMLLTAAEGWGWCSPWKMSCEFHALGLTLLWKIH